MISEVFFTPEQQKEIVAAVKEAEHQTSGEIRLFMEDKCKGDVLDRAAFVFEKLEMHKTTLRNGVLFYFAPNHKKFAILGDAGINTIVPPDFWNGIKNEMKNKFKAGLFKDGIITGIRMAGDALKQYFPHKQNDKNELSDEIEFGLKNE